MTGHPGLPAPAPEFTVTASRERYRSPWMVVREDDVVFPNGTPGSYAVVEREDFALVVPEEAPGRLVLIEIYRHVIGRRAWEFPQGSSSDGTLSPVEVAGAELAEETGFTAASWTPLGTLHEAYGYATSRCVVFRAAGLAPGPARPEPGEGVVRHRVLEVGEIWAMVDRGLVTDAVTIAALALYERAALAAGGVR